MTGHMPKHDGGALEPPPFRSPGVRPPSFSPGGAAIAAFVMGILSFMMCGPCTGVPALIVGLIELHNIRDRRSPEEGRPFALAGAILGAVNTAIAIVVVLIYGIAIIGFLITVGDAGFEWPPAP